MSNPTTAGTCVSASFSLTNSPDRKTRSLQITLLNPRGQQRQTAEIILFPGSALAQRNALPSCKISKILPGHTS